MKNFVLGFMYSPDGRKVALLEKNRPDWQKGLFNGIGGKIEPFDKSEIDALCREFEEEAGVTTQPENWLQFATLNVIGLGNVHVFKSFSDDIHNIENKTDEEISLFDTDKIPSNTIPNLKWLIPLGLDRNLLFESPLLITEENPKKTA